MEEAELYTTKPINPKTNPPALWADFVDSRRRSGQKEKSAQRASETQDVIVDKAELKSDVKALLNSVAVAIERLQQKTHGRSTQIREYEMVQADAQRVLNALNSPGSTHQLAELSKQEAAIRSLFSVESDKSGSTAKGDGDDDDTSSSNRSATAAPPTTTDSSGSDDDETTQGLVKRKVRLHAIVNHHMAIKSDAATLADDSKADLVAAVAVAGMLYEGYKNKDTLESFLAKTKERMEAAEQSSGASGAGASVEQRMDLIQQEAKKIYDSMGKDGAQTNARVIDAADSIIRLHLQEHKKDCAASLAEARQCLVEDHAHHEDHAGHLVRFDVHTKEWENTLDKTERGLNSAIGSTRDSLRDMPSQTPVTSEVGLMRLVSDTGLNDVFKGLHRHMKQSSEHLKAESGIILEPLNALREAEAQLKGMKQGHYHHADAKAIAEAAGTTEKQVIRDIAASQRKHHVPPPSHYAIKNGIDKINDAINPARAHGMAIGA